jgi:hypothetical protein
MAETWLVHLEAHIAPGREQEGALPVDHRRVAEGVDPDGVRRVGVGDEALLDPLIARICEHYLRGPGEVQ